MYKVDTTQIRGGFFSFFLCSQHVPFKFPMCSHWVLNMLSMFPMCSPRVFAIAPPFNLICFAQRGGLQLSIESSIFWGGEKKELIQYFLLTLVGGLQGRGGAPPKYLTMMRERTFWRLHQSGIIESSRLRKDTHFFI
jgi:hypothetical protein